MQQPSGKAALYNYGMVLGYSLLTDLLFELDRMAELGAAADAQIESMYGLQDVLRAEERPQVVKKETQV